LFQALSFEAVAGNWTRGMICPPILPPPQSLAPR
jgi:hypothetical protein